MDCSPFDLSDILLVSGHARLSNSILSIDVIHLILYFQIITLFQWEISCKDFKTVIKKMKKQKNKTIEIISNPMDVDSNQFKFIFKSMNNNHDFALFGIEKLRKYSICNITLYATIYCKQLNYKYKICKKLDPRKHFVLWMNDSDGLNLFDIKKFDHLNFEIYIKLIFINTMYDGSSAPMGFSWSNETNSLLIQSQKIWKNGTIHIDYKWKLDKYILTHLIDKNKHDVLYFSNDFGNNSFCLYLTKQKKKNNLIKLGLRLLKLPDSIYSITNIRCVFKIPETSKINQKLSKQINKKYYY
eukprot:205607_1